MKTSYLKGKYVFLISIMVVGITIMIVSITGTAVNRSVFFNSYLSLAIVGFFLFFFMSYGLYQGIGIKDDFPEYGKLNTGDLISGSTDLPNLPDIDLGDDIGAIILSIVLWVIISICLLIMLVIVAELFIFSLFFILTMLYWVFFRALKLVFNKSDDTKGNLSLSIAYSLGYTILFTGWIFGIVYIAELIK